MTPPSMLLLLPQISTVRWLNERRRNSICFRWLNYIAKDCQIQRKSLVCSEWLLRTVKPLEEGVELDILINKEDRFCNDILPNKARNLKNWWGIMRLVKLNRKRLVILLVVLSWPTVWQATISIQPSNVIIVKLAIFSPREAVLNIVLEPQLFLLATASWRVTKINESTIIN